MVGRKVVRMTASERREQLIGVGRAVFARKGYEATTVEAIARRARVSKPIVYEHFGGKEGLYAVVVDREMTNIVERVSTAMESGTPRQRFERAALAFLTYVRDNPDGFTVLSRDAPTKLAAGGLYSVLSDLAHRVGQVFAREFRKAGYDPSTAPIYAHALVGMVTYIGQWWTEVREPPVRDVASHLAALVWKGLRHLPRRPSLLAEDRDESP